MQTFNNVKTSGWSSSPMHGPVRFTKLKKIFIWMVWSCLKTLKILAGPCSPTHGPVLFTVWNEFFICLLCSRLEPFKFMAGPRSPLSLVTAQLIWHRWRTFLSWYYADFQQRLNECWKCSPKHNPPHFTVLIHLFVWMVWSFLKRSNLWLGRAPPNTA